MPEKKMLKIAKKVVWFMVRVLGWAFIVLYYAWFWPVLAILWVFDPGQNEPEVRYWKQKVERSEIRLWRNGSEGLREYGRLQIIDCINKDNT